MIHDKIVEETIISLLQNKGYDFLDWTDEWVQYKIDRFFCFKIQRDFLKVSRFKALVSSGRGHFLKLESWAGFDTKTYKNCLHIAKLLSMGIDLHLA